MLTGFGASGAFACPARASSGCSLGQTGRRSIPRCFRPRCRPRPAAQPILPRSPPSRGSDHGSDRPAFWLWICRYSGYPVRRGTMQDPLLTLLNGIQQVLGFSRRSAPASASYQKITCKDQPVLSRPVRRITGSRFCR